MLPSDVWLASTGDVGICGVVEESGYELSRIDGERYVQAM
jgi:hypothetical protein